MDPDRAASALRWCDWVEDVLGGDCAAFSDVFVHGDLHGYNQLRDQGAATLLAVVDFEESGLRDPHLDLRTCRGCPVAQRGGVGRQHGWRLAALELG